MAKSFGKGKPAAKPVEEEVEVEEAEAEEAEAEEAEAEAEEAEEGEEGEERAPIVRERKWNYGITMESLVKRVPGKECPSSVSEMWEHTAKPVNVERFKELAGSDWRHGLRVMARGGAITITTAGVTYPIPYDKEAAEEARQAREAARAAKKAAEAAEAEEEAEEEEAPPPPRPAAKAAAKAPAKAAVRRK